MNCREFDRQVVNLACGLPLDDVIRHNATLHAGQCTNCKAKLDRQRRVVTPLGELMISEQQINAPERIGLALREAFQQQTVSLPLMNHVPARSGFWFSLRWGWATAIAATSVLLALSAIFWWRTSSPKQEMVKEQRIEVTPQPMRNKPDQTPEIALPQDNVSPVRIASRATSKPRLRRQMNPVRRDEEEMGDFRSLRPNTFIEPSEFEHIVRLQIPRTTLALWGVKVDDDDHHQKVKAEVVFGEDGVARAIRILN